MYASAPAAVAARLATIEHLENASTLCLESGQRLAEMYGEAGRQVMRLASEAHASHDAGLGSVWMLSAVWQEVSTRQGPALLANSMDVLGETYDGLVRLMGAQWHTTSHLARIALEKSAWMAPPELEPGIGTAISAVEAGEELADGLVAASISAHDQVEEAVERRIRRRR